MSQTKLLHLSYDGNFQVEHHSRILSCVFDEVSSKVSIVVDETIFHPQGGGQPSDIGEIKSYTGGSHEEISVKIEKVIRDKSGLITHIGSITSDKSDNLFNPGDDVTLKVDVSNRKMLSECHTAGHVVDAAMAKCGLKLPPTKGYHYLDSPYVEYRGSIDVAERAALVEKLKIAFSSLVEEDISTKIELVNKSIANDLCNRESNYFAFDEFSDEEPIRVVTIAGLSCPCAGTHVRKTSDLKERGWNVIGIKSKKGTTRIRYNVTKQ